MIYSISYDLKIDFSHPVKRHYYTLRILPRVEVWKEDETLLIDGKEARETGRDSFSNRLSSGLIVGESSSFAVHLDAKVHPFDPIRKEEKDALSLGYFKYPSELTKYSTEIKDLASSLPDASPFSIAGDAIGLISSNMAYEKGSTDVNTTAAKALGMKKGVCQDYAHIMLSLLRFRGVICRYVAGLTLGEGESHAWVEVYENGYWKGYDPTRNKEADSSYIPLSYGRDALDSPINSGVYLGIVSSTLSVNALCREE